MKPTPIVRPVLVLVGAGAVGYVLSRLLAAAGGVVPVPSWLASIVIIAVAVGLLLFGLPIRRYLAEDAERREDPSRRGPRRHELDMLTAFRTLMFARACIYVGALVGGYYLGETLYFALREGSSLTGAILPTLAAALAGVALAAVAIMVERWGKLPPPEDEDPASSPSSTLPA